MRLSEGYGSGFALAPPLAGRWTDLEPGMAALLAARLGEAVLDAEIDGTVDGFRVLPLGFYPGWVLCDVQTSADTPGDHAIHSFLYGPDGFTALNGTSPPIHLHNDLHGLTLDGAGLGEAYLAFFCFFVRGEDGPFEIFETADRLRAKADGPEPTGVEHLVAPLSREMREPSASVFAATIVYCDSLFRARFRLHDSGLVEMLEDEPLRDGVSVDPPLRFDGTARRSAARLTDRER